ncbi:hypothetical protein SUGI_0945840 [Cryptomeria japonica]|uniref:BAG family molecular chaperone regulator 6 n=1 Tax=Cryptomeria japonica TaxID=3369 RepID=UPI0024149E36|nr:BAG family molecular chaperone regulator 6 [Cryptomeria japonica]GLJ44926.1 hypothetical protein SUGI_0945840 [Cryptomeria japonica]
MSPVYRRPYPAYYWAPTNVEAQPIPIREEPYSYREARPQEWGYGNCEGPYWYYHQPGKDGYYSYWPKYGDWEPKFYERNAKDFGGDFGRGFGRDLRPVYVYPPPPPAASGPFTFRPFHSGDQFRRPDEYPMRFVPVAHESASDPCEKRQVKPHCCGCPNHVCGLETRTMKGDERKGLTEGYTEEDVKTKRQNMQELAGPVVCFNPLEWYGEAPDNRNRNEGQAEHPVYWVPVNWNRNERDKDQERWLPGNWIPSDINSKPLGWGECKNELPGYWIPLDSSIGPKALEDCKKRSQFEGNENKNKFPGYWIPLDSIAKLQGEQKEKENSLSEGKLHPFAVLWIPEENLKMANSQEGIPNESLGNRPTFVQKFGNEDEKQRIGEASKETKARGVHVEPIGEGIFNMANPEEGTKNEGLEEEQKKINELGGRPVIVQEVGRVNERQRPEEVRKETKTREIPVKQLEEEKSSAAEKANESVTNVKARDIPVKQLEKEKASQAQVQKLDEKAAENHKASSPRASKLPPVCLRVDPLPGKRKTNGKSSSRSPSPPHKDNDLTTNASLQNTKPETTNPSLQNTKSDASKIPVELKKAGENASLKASKHAGETKKVDDDASSKASELGDETKKGEENASLKASKHAGEPKKVDDVASLKAPKLGDEAKNAGENDLEKNLILDSELVKVDQDLNAQGKDDGITKTELSRDQAALKIQAVYRGWQVRKFKPLRKLHEIAKIRHRMEELKQQIMSPEFEGELRRDDKTKVKMSETLMGLLLRLDTIQGLRPVVRDVRKSLARELVQLLEKLDTLVEEARSSHLQPCMIYERENKVDAVQQKIDNKEKGLDATEDSCNTLLGIRSENQEIENELTKDDNAEEKETIKHDSFEIENEVNNDGRENAFALKKAESKEEPENAITNNRETVEDNIPVEQETLKVSGNQDIDIQELENAITNRRGTVEDDVPVEQETLKVSGNREIEIPSLSIDLENEEAEKEDENLSNERKPLVASEEMISLSNEAVDKADKSEPAFEIFSVEEDKKSKPNNLMKQDSTLPPVVDKEICPLSILAQEQEAEASDSLNPLDDNANTSQKNAPLEQGLKLEVIGFEEEKTKSSPENDFIDREENYEPGNLKEPNSALPPPVENDICKSSTQVQDLEKNATLEPVARTMLTEAKAEKSEASLEKVFVEEKTEPNNLKEADLALSLAVDKEICPDNSNILDENRNVSEKNVSLDQEGEVMPIELEAEPENQINAEKVEVSGFQLNKCESKELEDALPVKTAGDSNVEFITETSSQVVSDSLSVSHSDGLDETNLSKMDKASNVAENMSGKGEFAASMAQESCDSAVEKATEDLITVNDFSAMSNVKNDLHLQNEEQVSRCSRATDDIESVASDLVGTPVTDNSINKNDLVHSENIQHSEPNISKFAKTTQDHDKWEEENEKLKEMVEKLVEAEKLQMATIAQLNDKIKLLENKLGKGKKTRKPRAGQLRARNHRVERNTKNAPALQC